jgi:prepilin-type N-terminal cleavage/methylation domain-containing protein
MARLTHTRRRTGFTLIELLVVIGIIAVLAALVTAAVGRVRASQMVKATETTLTSLQLGFDQQWKATLDQAREDGRKPPGAPNIPAEVWAWCGGDRDRTTALWAYIKLRLEFPQTFPEALSPVALSSAGLTPIVIPAKRTFNQLPLRVPTTPAEYRLQSAVLLYLILSERGGRGMVFSADDVANGDTVITDLAGNSYGPFRVFKDAWGQPIGFERFTLSPDANTPDYSKYTALRMDPATGKLVATRDPLDPLVKLGDATGWNTTLKGLSEAQVMPPLPPRGTLSAFYTFNKDQNRMPAITSFGQDKKPDLTAGQFNYLGGDDLFSYRLRREGKRGD